MRSALVAVLCVVQCLPLWSQVEWSRAFDLSTEKTTIWDAVDLDDGRVVGVSSTASFPSSRSWSLFMDPAGMLMGQWPLGPPGYSLIATAIKPTSTAGLVAFGSAWDSLSLSGHGVVSSRLELTGSPIEHLFHPVDDGMKYLVFQNVDQDGAGRFFISGGARSNFNSLPDQLLVASLDEDGEGFIWRLYGDTPGWRNGRHVIPQDGSMLVAMDGGGTEFGFSALTRYVSFDNGLEYVGGFPGTSVSGNGSTDRADSTLTNAMYMTPQAHDSIIVSSRFGNISTGLRSVVLRMGPDGRYGRIFLPRSDAPQDYPGTNQSHDLLPNGDLVFAMMENFFPGPPDPQESPFPNRIKVFRMDTMLNTLCTYTLDGADDGSYYYLTRIKATSDGGALLMGSIHAAGTNDPPRAWVARLGPDFCATGIEERQPDNVAHVYPNPGTNGFTLALNGTVQHGGMVELSDPMGRQVTSARLINNMATVDAERFAAGLYHYRVLNRSGSLVTSGRWIKE